MYSVLFVCTGNICRSPAGDGVLRHVLKKEGLDERVVVDSAGTHGYHVGDSPHERSIRTAAKRGYRLEGLVARKFIQEDFKKFDLILAMDQGHYSDLMRMVPSGYEDRVRLFMDFANRYKHLSEVPDPYYGGIEDYEYMMDLIEDGMEGLMSEIRSHIA